MGNTIFYTIKIKVFRWLKIENFLISPSFSWKEKKKEKNKKLDYLHNLDIFKKKRMVASVSRAFPFIECTLKLHYANVSYVIVHNLQRKPSCMLCCTLNPKPFFSLVSSWTLRMFISFNELWLGAQSSLPTIVEDGLPPSLSQVLLYTNGYMCE